MFVGIYVNSEMKMASLYLCDCSSSCWNSVVCLVKFAYAGFSLFEIANEAIAAKRGEKKPQRRPDVPKQREEEKNDSPMKPNFVAVVKATLLEMTEREKEPMTVGREDSKLPQIGGAPSKPVQLESSREAEPVGKPESPPLEFSLSGYKAKVLDVLVEKL